MKHDTGRIDDVLKRSMPSAPALKMEAALKRVAERVWPNASSSQSEVPEILLDLEPPRNLNWAWGPLVAATVLVVAIWIGMTSQKREIYGIVEMGDASLVAGRRIDVDQPVRTGDTGARFRLVDGSQVEVRAASEFKLERADDGVRINLLHGGLIVNAAKQRDGHLYVNTKDVTVSVIGTVFLINAEEEGSRVGVIEGEVKVQQGKTTKTLLPGEQFATSPQMQLLPVKKGIQWSRQAETHVVLMQQAQTAPTMPRRLEFEAASIRRSRPLTPGDKTPLGGGAPECEGIDGRIESGGRLNAGLGRCVGDHVSLLWLVAAAYDFPGLLGSERISGGPEWTTDLRGHGYQINAVASNPATTTAEDLRQMLRSMLEERFTLRVSQQVREVDGFVLSAAKGGLKLPPAAPNTSSEQPLRTERQVGEKGTHYVASGNATLTQFIEYLSNRRPLLSGPVLDETTGDAKTLAFNFTYFIPRVLVQAGVDGQRGGAGNNLGGTIETEPAYIALREALNDQLGIALKAGKVQARFLTIDNAEEPSEN